jgi:hypothetical protein
MSTNDHFCPTPISCCGDGAVKTITCTNPNPTLEPTIYSYQTDARYIPIRKLGTCDIPSPLKTTTWVDDQK